MANGGRREGAGRKSKAHEMGIQVKLDPMEDDFLAALHKAIKKGNVIAMKLYADYRFGKPTDKVDITTQGEKIEGGKHEVIFRDYRKKDDKS
jgi:hypothetical protein